MLLLLLLLSFWESLPGTRPRFAPSSHNTELRSGSTWIPFYQVIVCIFPPGEITSSELRGLGEKSQEQQCWGLSPPTFDIQHPRFEPCVLWVLADAYVVCGSRV